MLRTNTAIHNMSVHLGIGVLLAITVLVIIAFIVARRDKNQELLLQLDNAIYVLLFLGIIGICLAVVTPLVDYPDWKALFISPLVQVKYVLALLLFNIFMVMLYIRWKHGPNLWADQKLALYFVVLVLVGSAMLSVIGSTGAFITIRETSLEKLLCLMGIPIP